MKIIILILKKKKEEIIDNQIQSSLNLYFLKILHIKNYMFTDTRLKLLKL